MKKLLLILLIVPIIGIAQNNKIDGAIGLKFGMDSRSASDWLMNNGYGQFYNTDGLLQGYDKTAFGINNVAISLKFNKLDKLGYISFIFGDKSLNGAEEYSFFLKFKSLLSNKYGQPSDSSVSVARQYYDQLKNEDESERQNSIHQGLEKRIFYWFSREEDAIASAISLTVSENEVMLSYLDPSISDKKQKNINPSGL